MRLIGSAFSATLDTIWGRELYIDATKVQANASRDSIKPRFVVEAHLATLFAQEVGATGEERELVLTQEETVSSELSQQQEKTSLVELPT